MSDIRDFGSLIRQRRNSLRLSQEAVAALAFGNGDRKGYISSIETGRAKGLKPETARKLANALNLARDEVPPSLRWPDLAAANREGTAEDSHLRSDDADHAESIKPVLELIDGWFQDMQNRLTLSPLQRYRAQLGRLLAQVTRIMGRPFSLQSFCLSVTLAYVYLFFAGLVAYGNDGGDLGSLAIFARPDWVAGVSNAFLAATSAVVVVLTAMLVYRWASVRESDLPMAELRDLSQIWRSHRFRIFTGAIALGMAAVIVTALGTDTLAATMVIAIAGFGALSRLGPTRGARAGAFAGGVAGGIESLFDDGTVPDIFEGILFGGVLCGVAGFVSGSVARLADSPPIGAFMGASVGAAVGAVATVLVFYAMEVLAINGLIESAIDVYDFQVLTTADFGVSAILVLWAVLPVANAILDFVSYGVSVKLGYLALRSKALAALLLLLGFLDLVLAILLSAATLALVYGSLLAADAFLSIDLSPSAFFSDWWANPFGSGLWLTIMILSTLSWTVLHYALIVLPSISSSIASHYAYGPTKERLDDELRRRKFSFRSYFLSFLPLATHGFAYLLLLTSSVVLVVQIALFF